MNTLMGKFVKMILNINEHNEEKRSAEVVIFLKICEFQSGVPSNVLYNIKEISHYLCVRSNLVLFEEKRKMYFNSESIGSIQMNIFLVF